MYVKDVEDGKRTYRHIFIITFLIWYHLNVMLSMSKMSKIDQIHLRAVMLCMSKMSKIDQIHLRTVMLCMSKMSKIDQIHLRAIMLCMSKMSKIDQIHLRAVMLCMSKMGKEHTHTFWLTTSFPNMLSNPMYVEACRRLSSTCFNIQCLMVWLESPKSQLSKTFFGLKVMKL